MPFPVFGGVLLLLLQKKKDVKSWLAVPPGAVLCGTRDGWVLQGS